MQSPPPLPVCASRRQAVSTPPATVSMRIVFRIAALFLLAIGSVGIGAFGLPALRSPRTVGPAQEMLDQPSPESSPSGAVLLAGPAPTPDNDRPAQTPSRFDVPAAGPQLPSNHGPYALAGVIDREVQRALAAAEIPSSPLSGDAEFIRRIHLDLIGKVPSRDRVIAFLADRDPTKRARLIDELLARPEYGKHFARLWADLLVKRDPDNNRGLNTSAFQTWLAGQFNTGAGWDQIVRDMVTASGAEDSVPQTLFILANQDNRQPSPAKLTGSIGNLFLGIQIQCAECHTHPTNGKWNQNDFWGLAAFFGHTKAERNQGGKANKKMTGPATIREVEKSPVAKNRKGKKLGPAIVSGLRIAIPDPNDPRKTIRVAVGKYLESDKKLPNTRAPYRPHLAKWLTSEKNHYFAPAAVNRWWAHFFARGQVDPIEEMGGTNTPSHPELMRNLTHAFVGSGYDLKYLIRAICNSQTYQRTSRPVEGNQTDERLYSRMPIKVMDAKQLIDSLRVITRQEFRLPRRPAPKRGQRDLGDPLVRFLDTREYDDDVTEFSYGIPQLLKLMNTNLTAASSQVAAQLARKNQNDHARVIEDIYLTALARRPTVAEQERMVAYVRKKGDQVKGYAAIFWALLNSAEFVSNH